MICYDPKDLSKFTWGAEKHGPDAINCIKLMLDPDQPRPSYLPDSTVLDQLEQLGLKADRVATDFIRAMYKYALTKITSSVPKDYLSKCKQEFVLTVPAVWSDKAKDLTLKVGENRNLYFALVLLFTLLIFSRQPRTRVSTQSLSLKNLKLPLCTR